MPLHFWKGVEDGQESRSSSGRRFDFGDELNEAEMRRMPGKLSGATIHIPAPIVEILVCGVMESHAAVWSSQIHLSSCFCPKFFPGIWTNLQSWPVLPG